MGGKARWRKLQRVVGCLPQGPHAALDKHKQRRERAKTRDAKRWRLGDDVEEEEDANTILIGKAKERKKEEEMTGEERREVEVVNVIPIRETKEREKEEMRERERGKEEEELDVVLIGKTRERRKKDERKETEALDNGTSEETKVEEERKEREKIEDVPTKKVKERRQEEERKEVEELDKVIVQSSKENKNREERMEVREADTTQIEIATEKRKKEEKEEQERKEVEEVDTTIKTSKDTRNDERKDRKEQRTKKKDKVEGEEKKMEDSTTKTGRAKDGEGEEKRKEHEADSMNAGKAKKMKTGKETGNEEEADTKQKGKPKERQEDEKWKKREDSIKQENRQDNEGEDSIRYQKDEGSDVMLGEETVERREEEEKQKAWVRKSKWEENYEEPHKNQEEKDIKKKEKEEEKMKHEKEEEVQKFEKMKEGKEEEVEEEAEEVYPSERERLFLEQEAVIEVVENRAGVWTPSLTGWVFRPYGDTTLEEELRKAQEEEDGDEITNGSHDNGQRAAKFFLSDDESDSDTAIFVDVSQPALMEDQNLQLSVAPCSSSLPHREALPDEVLGTPLESPLRPTEKTTQEDEDVELVLADAIEEDYASETVDPLATVSTMEAVMTECPRYGSPQFDYPFQFYHAETLPRVISVDPPTESAKMKYINSQPLSLDKADESITKESKKGRTSHEESVRESMVTTGAKGENFTKHEVYRELEPEMFSSPSAFMPREEAPPAMNCDIGPEDLPWSDPEELQEAKDARYICDSEAETRFFSLYPEYYPNEREKSQNTENDAIAYGNPKFPCFSGSCDSEEAAEEEVYMAAQDGGIKDGVKRHKGKFPKIRHRLAPQRKTKHEAQNVTGVKEDHTESEMGQSYSTSLPCDASGSSSEPLVFDSSTSHLLQSESELHPSKDLCSPVHQTESTETQFLEEEQDGAEAGQDALELEGRMQVEQGKQTLVRKARQWIKGVAKMGGTRREDHFHGKQTILEATEGTCRKEVDAGLLRDTTTAEATPDSVQAALSGRELRVHYTPERVHKVCFTTAERVKEIESGEDSRVGQVNRGDRSPCSPHASLKEDSRDCSHPECLPGDVVSVEDFRQDPTLDKDTKQYITPSEKPTQHEEDDDKNCQQSEPVEDLKKHSATDEMMFYNERKKDYEIDNDSSPYTKTEYSKDGQKPSQLSVPLAECTNHSPLGEDIMYDFASAQSLRDPPTAVQSLEGQAARDSGKDMHSTPTTKHVSFSFPDAPAFSTRPRLETAQDHYPKGAEHQETHPKPVGSASFYEGSNLYYTPESEFNSPYSPVEGLKIFCQSGETVQAHYKPDKDSRTHETHGKESMTNMPTSDFHADYSPENEDLEPHKPSVDPTCESTATHYTIIEEYIVSYSPAREQYMNPSTEGERMKCMVTDEEKPRRDDPTEEHQRASAGPQEDEKRHPTSEEKRESHSTLAAPQTSHSTFESDKNISSTPREEQRDFATPEETRKSRSTAACEELTSFTLQDDPKELPTLSPKQQFNPIFVKESSANEGLMYPRPAEETYTLFEAQKSNPTYETPPDSDDYLPAHGWNSPYTPFDLYCDNPAENTKKENTPNQSTSDSYYYAPVEEVQIQSTPEADRRIDHSPADYLEACHTGIDDLGTHSTLAKSDEENKDKEENETREGKAEAEMRTDDEGNSLNRKERKNSHNRRRRKESEREGKQDNEMEGIRESERSERSDSGGQGRQRSGGDEREDRCRERRDTGKEERRDSETEREVGSHMQGRRNSDRKERKDSERDEGYDESKEDKKSSEGRKREEENGNKDGIRGDGKERKEGGRQGRRPSDYERNREDNMERKWGSEMERRHSDYQGRRNDQGKKEGLKGKGGEEKRDKEEENESGGETEEWSKREGEAEEEHKEVRDSVMKGRNKEIEEKRNMEMEKERERERKEPEGRKEENEEKRNREMEWERKGPEERNEEIEERRNREVEEEREWEQKVPEKKDMEDSKKEETTKCLEDKPTLEMTSSTLASGHEGAGGSEAQDTHSSFLGVPLTSSNPSTANPNPFNVSAAKEDVPRATGREDSFESTTPETCALEAKLKGSAEERVMEESTEKKREFQTSSPQDKQMEGTEERVTEETTKKKREFKPRQKQGRNKQQPTSPIAVDNPGNAAADGNLPQDGKKEGKSMSRRRRNRRNKGTNQREQGTSSPAPSDTRESWTASKAKGTETPWSVEDRAEGNSHNPREVHLSQQQQELTSPRQSPDSSGSSAKLTVTQKDDTTPDTRPCKMWGKNPANPKKQQERYGKFPTTQGCARESSPRISRLSEEQKAAGAGEYAVLESFGAPSGKEVQEVERKGRKEKEKGSEGIEEEREVTVHGGSQKGGVAKQAKNWSPRIERKDRKGNRREKKGKMSGKSDETVKEREVKSPREGLCGVAQRGGNGTPQRRPPLLETPPMEPYSYMTQKGRVKAGGYASPGSLLGSEPLPGPPRATGKLRYPEALLQPLSPPPSPPPHKSLETKSKEKTRATLHEEESNKESSIHPDPSLLVRKTSQPTMYTIPEAAPAKPPENPESELASGRPQCPPKPLHLKDTSGRPSSDPQNRSWPVYQDKQLSDSSSRTSFPQPSPHTDQLISPPRPLTPVPSVDNESFKEHKKSLPRCAAPLLPTPKQQQQETQQQQQPVDPHRNTPNPKPPLNPKPSLAELDPLQKITQARNPPPEKSKASGNEEASPTSSAGKVSVAQRMKFPGATPAALEAHPDSSMRTQASHKPEMLEARSTPADKHPAATGERSTAAPSLPRKTAGASSHSPSYTAPGSSPHTERSEPSSLRTSEGQVQKPSSAPRQQRSNMDKASAPDFPKDAKPGGRYADVANKGQQKGGHQEPQRSPPIEGDQGTSSASPSEEQTQKGQSSDPPKEGTVPGPREAAKGMKKKKRR